MVKRPKVNWDWEPLGEMSDVELAGRHGVTSGAVRHARLARGIPRHGPRWINWAEVKELGEITDADVARRFGVCEATVQRARKRLGIRPYRDRYGRAKVDWDHVPFGKFSDYTLAYRLGVSPSTVCSQRRKRGIPPLPRRRKTLLLGDGETELLRQVLESARSGRDVSVLCRNRDFTPLCASVEAVCAKKLGKTR